jgi:hypothetical protein
VSWVTGKAVKLAPGDWPGLSSDGGDQADVACGAGPVGGVGLRCSPSAVLCAERHDRACAEERRRPAPLKKARFGKVADATTELDQVTIDRARQLNIMFCGESIYLLRRVLLW